MKAGTKDRYTVLVSQDGEYLPFRERITDSRVLALNVAKDETKRAQIEGDPIEDIHIRVEVYDMDADRIIYNAQIDWYAE